MKIKKDFIGLDGEKRTWYLDTDNKILIFKGKAGDFKLTKQMDAQEFIDSCE